MGAIGDGATVKGPLPASLDEISRTANAMELMTTLHRAVVDDDRDFTNFSNILGEHLFAPLGVAPERIENLKKYLQERWFDENSPLCEFRGSQTRQEYANGVRDALQLSIDSAEINQNIPKPIEANWLVGFSEVKTIILDTPELIVFLIATPRPSPEYPNQSP